MVTIVMAASQAGKASLFFVGAHVPYWLSHGGFSHAMVANCAGFFLQSAGGLVVC